MTFPFLDTLSPRRRWALIGVFLATAGAIFYFFWEKRPYAPLHAASEQAAVVLYAREGMDGLNAVFPPDNKDINQRPLLKQYRAALKGISALLTPEVAQWGAGRPQAAVFSLHANDSLQPLLVLDAGEALEPRRVLGGAAEGAWLAYRFKGYDIYEHRGGGQWVVAVRGNLLLASRFSYLVEEALVQLGRRDRWWLRQADLTKAPVTVLARPRVVAERAQAVLASGWGGVAEALATAVEATAVGLWPDSSEVVVRVSEAIPSGKALTRTPVSALLPDHVALYLWHTSEQPGQALAAFAQSDRNDAAFKQYILPWCGREAALVWLEPQAGGTTFDGAWVCSVRDEGLARRLLEAYGAHSGMVRRYRYHAFEVRQFLDPALLAPLLFRGVEGLLQNPACAVFDGYAVFAPSAPALELWLDKYIVSQTLGNDPDYLTLLSRQRPESQWAILANGRYLPLLAQKMLVPQAEIQAEVRRLAAKGLMGLDFHPEGRGVWRAPVEQQRISRPTAAALSLMWKASLPAAVVGTPQWIAPSETEPVPLVLAQDAQGQLHCLEAGGRLRWSKALGQPIRSGIHVLEGLPGGQRHYVFSTAEALWMLDDQGREALGFPLRLQSPATNGVLVVPLESARRYGLFVACANGNLYGFDAYGRPLPGWNPKAGVGRVEHPLLHFTWSNKDYIVALSTQGRLTCADRAGNPHFADVQLQGAFTTTPPLCIWEKNTPYILCVNDAGRAFRCSTTGQVVEYALGWNAQQRHSSAALSSSGKGREALIAIASGQRVRVRPLAGNSLRPAELTLPAPADTLWAAGEHHFGVLCRAPRQLFLLHREGRLSKGFPLSGHTPLDLLPVGVQEQWLVVGYDTEVYAYRLTEQ